VTLDLHKKAGGERKTETSAGNVRIRKEASHKGNKKGKDGTFPKVADLKKKGPMFLGGICQLREKKENSTRKSEELGGREYPFPETEEMKRGHYRGH